MKKHQTHKTTVFFYYANMSNNLQQELIKTKKTKNKMRKEVEKQFIKTETGSYFSLLDPKRKTILFQCIFDHTSTHLQNRK